MDFIEQWFGISPDGGNGTTEAFFFITALIIIVAVLARWRFNKTRRD
jgi:hypothetical protein